MSPQCSNGGVTILVVDDEPLVLDMISQELTAQGFAVLEAETGEAALSIIESGQTVDVLFTDIILPGGLDGWRLAAMAQEAKPGLPVIYVTGYNVNREAAVPQRFPEEAVSAFRHHRDHPHADWPQPNGCRRGPASSARQAWWRTTVALNALTGAGPILSAWKQATSYTLQMY